MRRMALAALAAAGAVGASAAAATTDLPAPVTLDGVGGVVPGMTVAQVAAAWGVPLRAVPSACTVVSIRRGPMHGRALFAYGRFGAVFFDRGAAAPGGIAIGSTLAGLRRAYGGRLQGERGSHFYFLTRGRGPHWQLRFDTDRANRVVQIGFGREGSVHVVAGCA